MKFKSLVTVVSLFLGSAAADKDPKKCIALAMSGGGVKGAYEAGALYGMVHEATDKTQFEYDVVTGVSAGAINTAGVSLFKKGDEVNMVNILSERWQGLTTSQMYSQWFPFGIITGINKKSGVLNTKPLFDFLTKFFNEFGGVYQRKIAVSAVDMETGNYEVYDETNPDPIKAIVSSASIPFVFPNQQWSDGTVVMDGGAVWNLNLVSAVKRCREQVDDDSQIILDIVICDSKDLPKWEKKNNAMSNYLRFENLKSYRDGIADISGFLMAFPKITLRYYVEPTETLPGGLNLLNADNSTSTYPMQMLGRKDGAKIVQDGKKVGELITNWRTSAEVRNEFPYLPAYLQNQLPPTGQQDIISAHAEALEESTNKMIEKMLESDSPLGEGALDFMQD